MPQNDESRLLILRRTENRALNTAISRICQFRQPRRCQWLVLNNSRVIPATNARHQRQDRR